MMGAGIFSHVVAVLRPSNALVQSTPAAQTLSLAVTPSRASLLVVSATGTGSVYASGSLGGVGAAETFAFGSAGILRGRIEFDAIASMTTSLSGGTVAVDLIDRGGNPQNGLMTVASGIPAGRGIAKSDVDGFPIGTAGPRAYQKANWSLDYSEVFEPHRGDLLEEQDTGNRWRVRNVEIVRGGFRPYGWQLDTERHETGAAGG